MSQGETPPVKEGSGEQGSASTPGGIGAVFGVRVLRYLGVQSVSLAVSSFGQLATLFAVAYFLGPAALGQYALVFFLASLVGHVLTIASKPGTIRRTFGAGDDDDDDDDEAEETSESPTRSLGTGLIMATVMGLVGGLALYLARAPVADLLLGGREDESLVAWAAGLAAATVVFRLVSIVIWFERRPTAFIVTDVARPIVGLIAIIALLAGGAGLEGALAGTTLGTTLAALLGLVLLRGSFELVVVPDEVREILKRGAIRAPVMMSYWTVANGDVFLLSLYISDTELGVYTLVSRLGFIAAFPPQGFRVAMRPLRKAAVFQALEDQYGKAAQRGRLLGYFMLVCIASILAMLLVGDVLVELVPSSFAEAAPLIPAAAAAMVGPALLRTVKQQTTWPDQNAKLISITTAVGAALVFIAVTLALTPELGYYAAPIGIGVGFALPSLYLFVRCQRSPDRIDFPYSEVGRALALAAVLAGLFIALPGLPTVLELLVAVLFGAVFLAGLLVIRAIPEVHRPALLHMLRSVVSGRPDEFDPRRGLRVLDEAKRDELRAAITAPVEPAALDRTYEGRPGTDGRSLVRSLRAVGAEGGMSLNDKTPHDAAIAHYLFEDEPTAVRNATMRRLLEGGAKAADLRALEDLVDHLSKLPDRVWEDRPKGEGGGAKLRERAS
ncbi:MAG: lipopolysaccharide biosynthesis protein [Solirubrobacterales bacterium]|nr:lipopolysaccharide biosynthesis protein [Solirubrobacterales bacterium]